MAIAYDCPHCGTHLKVFDEFAGRSGPCAVCAKIITIPHSQKSDAAGTAKVKTSETENPAGLALGTILTIMGAAVGLFCVVLIVVVLIVQVGLPAAAEMRAAEINQKSQDQLERLMAALNAYHADHGSYPPAYFVDEAGKPSHSWRVMILPYLGREDVYRQYDFTKSWNSVENTALINQMPSEFTMDRGMNSDGMTNIVAVVGRDTIFPYEKSTARSEIIDDPSTVLALVELNGPGLEWTRPDHHLDIAKGNHQLTVIGDPDDPLAAASGSISGNIVMISEDSYHLNDMTAVQMIEELATKSGGEAVIYDLEAATQ